MKVSWILVPAAALSLISCQSNSDSGGAYEANPYYGPQGGGSSSSDYVYAAPGSDSGYQAPDPGPPSADYGTPAPPSPSPSGGSSRPSSSGGTHVVARGDTLWSLSRRYGTTVAAIKDANGLSSDLIQIGQKLRLP